MLAEYSGLVVLVVLGSALAGGVLVAQSVAARRAPAPDAAHAPVARARPPSHFLSLAAAFLVLDVAVVFLAAWVGSFRALGWFGFGAACSFAAPLAIALVYAWRKGALQW